MSWENRRIEMMIELSEDEGVREEIRDILSTEVKNLLTSDRDVKRYEEV